MTFWSYIGSLIPGTIVSLFGTLLLIVGIAAKNIDFIVIGSIIIFVGLFFIVQRIRNHRKARRGFFPEDSIENIEVIPGIVFPVVGSGALLLGINEGNPILIIGGAFFIFIGLLMMYIFIQSIRGNMERVTIKKNDRSEIITNKSNSSDEEKRTNAHYKSPSKVRANKVTSNGVSWSRTFLLLSIICGIFTIYQATGTSILGLYNVISSLIFTLIFFFLFIISVKSPDKIERIIYSRSPSELVRNMKSTPKGSKSTVNGYITCHHCGALNKEGSETCRSCKKRL